MKISGILQKPMAVLVLSTLLVAVSAWPAFIALKQGVFTNTSVWFSICISIGTLVSMFIIPICVIRHVFKKNPKDFGLQLPENLQSAIWQTGLVILVFTPIMLFFSRQPEFQAYYQIHETGRLFFLSIMASAVYYISEEFLFRGFLLFSLYYSFKIQKYHAVWISSLLFTILHLGKPTGEVFLALSLSFILCNLSLRHKSFIPAFVAHFVLAGILNLAINFT